MKLLTLISSLFLSVIAYSQNSQTDSSMYILHKNAQKIGREKAIVSKSGNKTIYDIDFKYVDRGSPVTLKAQLIFNGSMEPVSYRIKGGTSRFSAVNDSVLIQQNKAATYIDSVFTSVPLSGVSFPVAGYSPATTQMLLLLYWKKHGHPESVHMLPSGNVHIVKDGLDTFSFENKSHVFERYHIGGLIWGNELLWTNIGGQLICLITNDAEGDKQEMMLAPYENLLPEFIGKAAFYGMKLFTQSDKPVSEKHAFIAITGANLVDVINKKRIPNSVILIENGKIKSVGTKDNITIPANATIVDAQGKTILPGLWDMHAHFSQAEWGPAYLADGVTTVRDVGNEFNYINVVKETIDDGKGVGPNILKAGLIDGKGPYSLGIEQADTKEDAIREVQKYKQNNFVQIKIYSSVKPEIVKVICDEAHRLGMTVTGHVPEGMNIIQAVDSGMDMINHISYVDDVTKHDKMTDEIDFKDSANQAVFQFLKAHHTVIDPTLGVYDLAYRPVTDSITAIEPNFASLPEPLKPLFMTMGISDPGVSKGWKIGRRNYSNIVYELHKEGVTIVTGTDMGFPGNSVFRELELYVGAGLTPMEAIQTATIIPAGVMNQEKNSGSITPGKQADLMIVDGDPLRNIREIRNVTMVFKNGEIYSPTLLHKMAGFQ